MNRQEKLENKLQEAVDYLNRKVSEWPDNTQRYIVFVKDGTLVLEPIYEAQAEMVEDDDDEMPFYGSLGWLPE